MWISNTGVVVMLLPIIFAIQKELLCKELSTETVLETVKVQSSLKENDDFSASGKDHYHLLHQTLEIKLSCIQVLDSKGNEGVSQFFSEANYDWNGISRVVRFWAGWVGHCGRFVPERGVQAHCRPVSDKSLVHK